MKKKDLKKIALLGIAGGCMLASQGAVQADDANSEILPNVIAAGCGAHGCNHGTPSSSGSSRGYVAEADENMMADSGQMMTEDQLMSQLSDQGKQIYNGLSPQGKSLALKLASKSAFRDKNMAVRAAAQKEAREQASPSMGGQQSSGSYSGQSNPGSY